MAAAAARVKLATSPAVWILAVLVLAGGAIRAIACAAVWPASTTLSDAASYATDAASNPLGDPQHPAGYPALLALLGVVTHNVAVVIVLQHVLGIAAGVVLFAAVRRLVGSSWPALVASAVVLLDGDEIFLEHNVMSEGPFLFVLTIALYACARALDAPERSSRRWSVLAAIVVAMTTIMRTAGAFAIPVLAVAIAMAPQGIRHGRWRMSARFVGVAAVLLTGYACANLAGNGRFELAPASGWHLYARVAPFADCRSFTPPAGTKGLCESSLAARRWGPDFYLYAARSPARRQFGHVGSRDATVGAFALQVMLHQPAAAVRTVWVDFRRYFVPSSRPHGWYKGWDIQPQLDWARVAGVAYTRDTLSGMAKFFDRFVPRRDQSLVAFMHSYQQLFGFGATLLSVCTLLTLVGLLVGPRRNRIGVLLFGVGGLAQLMGPTVGVLYMGRYTVPLAGLFAAGGAISAWSLLYALANRASARKAPCAHRQPIDFGAAGPV